MSNNTQLLNDIKDIGNILNNNIVITIDFESANQSRLSICEVGICIFEKRNLICREHHFFNPLIPGYGVWQKRNLKYPYDFLLDKPSILDYRDTLYNKLTEASLIVAHHYETEVDVFHSFREKYEWPSIESSVWTCTYRLSKKYINQLSSYSLPNICKHIEVSYDAHNAISDAEATFKVLAHIVDNYDGDENTQISLFDNIIS